MQIQTITGALLDSFLSSSTQRIETILSTMAFVQITFVADLEIWDT